VRLYTFDEAEALLPRVVPVLEQMRDAFLRLRVFHAALAAEARGASGDGNLLTPVFGDGDSSRHVLESLNEQLRDASAQLAKWDIEVKDPERGLIDFRSDRKGEVVYLCYLLGEPHIEWWHRIDAGFAGREPL
jgi:hypothetical protein